MQMIELTREQVEMVYEIGMKKDFPDNERKPLPMILRAIDQGTYECLGIEEAGEILGYAFLVKQGKDYLFDYLAVLDGGRNQGLGTWFLQQIAEHYKDADSVIGEVEDPDYAVTEEDRALQKRRLAFYLRNGYLNTGVKVSLFGVDYLVLEMNLGKAHSISEIQDLYKMQYRKMLPKILYLTKVKVKKE